MGERGKEREGVGGISDEGLYVFTERVRIPDSGFRDTGISLLAALMTLDSGRFSLHLFILRFVPFFILFSFENKRRRTLKLRTLVETI